MNNGDKSAFGFANDGGVELGLSKREYFATMAMQGMLSGFVIHEKMTLQQVNIGMNLLVEFSVKHADALLAELEKPTSAKNAQVS